MLSFSFRFGTDDALGLTKIPFSIAEQIGLENDHSVHVWLQGPHTAVDGWKEDTCALNITDRKYVLDLSDKRIPMGWMCHLTKATDHKFYLLATQW